MENGNALQSWYYKFYLYLHYIIFSNAILFISKSLITQSLLINKSTIVAICFVLHNIVLLKIKIEKCNKITILMT